MLGLPRSASRSRFEQASIFLFTSGRESVTKTQNPRRRQCNLIAGTYSPVPRSGYNLPD